MRRFSYWFCAETNVQKNKIAAQINKEIERFGAENMEKIGESGEKDDSSRLDFAVNSV